MNMNLVKGYKKEAEIALREWQEAEKKLDYADADLLESVMFEIKSKQSRYTAFARRLKNEVMK